MKGVLVLGGRRDTCTGERLSGNVCCFSYLRMYGGYGGKVIRECLLFFLFEDLRTMCKHIASVLILMFFCAGIQKLA